MYVRRSTYEDHIANLIGQLETMDIRQAQRQLVPLRKRMQEILEELKAEQEDVMGDFDAEDFKRTERENRE